MTNTSRKQHWLINIRSGNGAGARLLDELSRVEGVEATPITFASLDQQISSIPEGDMVVVAGGDGTFSSVLGSSQIRNRRTACVPLGTANDLARDIGLSRKIRGVSLQDLPNTLSRLPTQPFAVWQVSTNGTVQQFVNYVSIGYEGAVVADFDRWRKTTKLSGRLTNRIAYTLFGTRHALMRIKGLSVAGGHHPSLSCDPTTGLIITNIKSHLGLGLSNAESSPHDDTIECISVPTVFGFASMLCASLGILPPPTVLTKGTHIRISGIPKGTPMQIDGEAAAPVLSGSIECTLKHFAQVCVAQHSNTTTTSTSGS